MKDNDSKIKQLMKTASESPKNAAKTINSLIDKLGSALSGTVEFEVPKKFEKMFSKFNDAENVSKEEAKSLVKGFDIKKLDKYYDGGEMVPVSLDLSKVKSIFKKGAKSVQESDVESTNESISLLESPETVATVSLIAGPVDVAVVLLILAIPCYALYVSYLAYKYNVINIFSDGKETSTALEAIGSMAVAIFLPLVYVIILHIKIHKMKKNGELKESLDGDSILDSMYESTEDLASNESNHDSDLIEAYRKVVEDLTRRVPKDNDAMI